VGDCQEVSKDTYFQVLAFQAFQNSLSTN